jgi:hypothetical protein
MAQPHSVLHVPRPLHDYVVAYRPELAGYLGLNLLPRNPVKHKADQIRKENKGMLLRKRDLRIGSDGRLREIEFKMDASGTFATVPYGGEVILYRDEMADADDELQYQQRKIDHGLVAIYTLMEFVGVKDVMRVVGNWGSNTTNLGSTPSAQYEKHFGSGTPIEDCLAICGKIEALTGHRPNTIAMHSLTWDQIATHPQVLARGENQQGGLAVITPEQFEKIIRVPPGTIKLTAAVYNIAAENATDDFRSFIGPDILFAYNEPGKINTFGLGSIFTFAGESAPGAGLRNFPGQPNDVPGADIAMRAYDAPWLGKDGAIVIKLTTEFDVRLVNNQAGWLLRNAVDGTNTGLFAQTLNN